MDSKPTKTRYRVRHWREYNAVLVNRSSLTVWVEERAVQRWRETQRTGRRGATRVYSDLAIQCALTLKVVFCLPLRATEGLLISVLELMGLTLPVPDNTPRSRRQQTLRVVIPRYRPGEHLPVVVDSTGLKVYGEGEWKVRVHGWGRRRTWRKLHLGVDEASREIVATLLSTANVNDSTAFPSLLKQIENPLDGDGGVIVDPYIFSFREREHVDGRSIWF